MTTSNETQAKKHPLSKIELGSILTVLTLTIAGVYSFATLQARVAKLETSSSKQDTDLDDLKVFKTTSQSKTDALGTKVSGLVTKSTGFETRLNLATSSASSLTTQVTQLNVKSDSINTETNKLNSSIDGVEKLTNRLETKVLTLESSVAKIGLDKIQQSVTQGVRKIGESSQDAVQQVEAAWENLPPDVPVGAVLPFFATPAQIKALAPKWLPADGAVCKNKNSPFVNSKLPDLRNRFIRGAASTANVVSSPIVGGADTASIGGAIYTGKTTVPGAESDMKHPGFFLIMTGTDEHRWSQHKHPNVATVPKYSGLVYLVKVEK